MKLRSSLVFTLFITFSFQVFANEDGAYLDPPYKNLIAPINDVNLSDKNAISRSPFAMMIKLQSSVKSQGSRGTCSIFSAAAMLESHLIQFRNFENPDVSEEWIEYLAISHRSSTTDGSWSFYNWSVVSRYGLVMESALPYIGSTWESAEYGLAKTRCGELEGRDQKVCLIAHWNPRYLTASIEDLSNEEHKLYNPEFAEIKKAAIEFKETQLRDLIEETNLSGGWGAGNYRVYGVSSIRELLQNNIPVTMGHDFYYGSYNHSKAPSLGMQRNMDHWSKGIVGYPEVGSVDRKASMKERAGHSVLIVGYDDDIKIVTNVLMEDGTTKEFEYKGAYIFKNSWGQDSFGRNFTYRGTHMPGYGIMPYKYAHDLGSFYKLPVIGEQF